MSDKRISVDPVLILCAVRYTLGRESYMVGTVTEELLRVAPLLPPMVRLVIERELIETLGRNEAGEPCDQRKWKACLDLLQSLA